jgi:glycosyltransferase involved in cell wall biosynthesis
MSLPENLRGMRFILNVGTYDSNKGQHLLLRAFAQIAHEHSDLLLVFAGRPGPALSDLRALASELRMEERVSFLQGLPHCDVLVLFQNAILFALTSQREGFPLVLLEAGFLCVPVIATAVGGVPEAIRNEEEGMLIQSEDQPALEHALRRLLSDERMRENLARNLRKRVLTSFTWEYAYRRLLEITHGSFPQAAAD